MEPLQYDADSTSPEPDTKRRKLRKGTKSCWDCKKRKVKCNFDAASSTVCTACRRRGVACVGQDHPEEESHSTGESNREPLARRIQRVEALLEQLVEDGHDTKNVGSGGYAVRTHDTAGYFTPASDTYTPDSFNSSPHSYATAANPATPGRPQHDKVSSGLKQEMTEESVRLSEALVKAFPSQDDVDVFCDSEYITTFYYHQIFTKEGHHSEHDASTFIENFAKIPNPTSTPPTLVAKKMMVFALLLQFFVSQQTHGLAEHPKAIMSRLVDTTSRLVTTNDCVVCCIEGLECIILEGVYHFNSGNLRKAWITFKRARTVAQLMKFDVPNQPSYMAFQTNPTINPRFIWFRIDYMDTYLSLMLGLSHSGYEAEIENDISGETLSCKLERAHTRIAKRIIDRNRRGPSVQELSATRSLDHELLNIAKTMPDQFWLPPDWSRFRPNTKEAFWEAMRLCDQLHHYNLVHLLHLPHLLRCDKESSYNTNAKIACVNASREIVSRCIAFHNFNRNRITVYCRTADFLALMAGMTIILTHIDSHRLQETDWRAHQRLGDRAMVEQLLHEFESVGKNTNDGLTYKSAEQLRRLLEVESATAHGLRHSAHDTVRSLEEDSGELQLSIPYYGIIKIGREGITKNQPTERNLARPSQTVMSGSAHVANHSLSVAGFGSLAHQNPGTETILGMPNDQPLTFPTISMEGIDCLEGIDSHDVQDPGLVAGIDDWAFQGVDAAFFDSLIRGAIN
ncbi:hypothetical protein BS50DRAFT_635087 [Corynespora cassiicola Philippines]|uniref:Zn(2)-C6 fungal-type domain-containing protein n=1 Tax=Corynespora cassiicola Philippines TaxID=1448308 RepID=A0A2T2NKC5_CORCC|nr:hypothetical protein BS50DRAFT_635087 [Corynespora cassiicola Philippines]